MKTIILLAIFGLLLIVSSSNAKNLYDDKDMEFSDKQARMFLRAIMGDNDNDDDDDGLTALDTRQTNQNCVACKLGIVPCCAPNICQKKFLRPDKCIRIKPGK
jgi:hypothetical protein